MSSMKPQSQTVTIWVLLVALIIACGTAFYFYRAGKTQDSSQTQAAAQAQQAQVQALVAKVGQLIVLPQNETPTIATVVDPALLKSQPFFADAQKGDLVLIYTSAKKAILYDPAQNKIVQVAPITIGTPSAAPVVQTPTPTPTTSTATSTKH